MAGHFGGAAIVDANIGVTTKVHFIPALHYKCTQATSLHGQAIELLFQLCRLRACIAQAARL